MALLHSVTVLLLGILLSVFFGRFLYPRQPRERDGLRVRRSSNAVRLPCYRRERNIFQHLPRGEKRGECGENNRWI
ncbi:hypothetical protein FB451DRAFT_1210272 [Mycena latifolia]|nr:hypothetical protein FB451DRAFT_1210272 [Mycena latifolia]